MNWAILIEIALKYLPQILASGQAPWASQLLAAILAYDHNTVRWVQGALNQIVHPNPPLVVDGVWGPKTKAAVEAFEATVGIQAGGVLSEFLISALRTAVQKVPTT